MGADVFPGLIMKISVILLAYNHWELTHARLWEIYRHLPVDEVILVDDNSDEADFISGVSWWMEDVKGKLPLRYIRNKKNMPFGYSMNKGCAAATGDVYVLLCNDVKVQGNFIPDIVTALAANSNILIGNRLLDRDTGWNTFDGVVYPYLEGYMLASTKEVWAELGGFDYKVFFPYDFEDVDLSTNARSLGIELFSLNTSKINHLGAGTIGYNPAREAITLRNKEKFREKWCK